MKLVSIIMPVYNVEKYVAESIDSVLFQTYKNIELIIINDGSKDNSLNICEAYAKQYNNIRLFTKENGGLSSARNFGIEKAKGDYLLFLDSDDLISSEMVGVLVDSIERSNSDIAVCDMSSDIKDMGIGNEQELHLSTERALEMILKEIGFSTSAGAKLFRREVFEDVRFPVGRIYEDYATIYLAIGKSQRISYIKKVMYYYRVNLASITHSAFSEKRMQYFKASEEVQLFIKENYPALYNSAKMRDVRYAISFYKQMVESNYNNKGVESFLRKVVKESIWRYLFTSYSILSKAYGLVIAHASWVLLRRIKHGK